MSSGPCWTATRRPTDLWIAWALLEAGRCGNSRSNTETGKFCWRGLSLKRRWRCRASARCCCREKSVLPMTAAGGLTSAIFRRSWPPTLCFGALWPALRDSNLRLLLETAPKGFTPDCAMRKERLAAENRKSRRSAAMTRFASTCGWACSMMAISRKRVCWNASRRWRRRPRSGGTPGESEYRHRQNQRSGASGFLRGNAAVFTGRRGPVGATPARRR